ncbi:hypothetical protein V1264_022503 [Littorina saxatilis]|uniref:Uncharacterized protein n=2 Tax=Littorina saxatilis TaxID=31220 RepID=A0AAN9AKH5_9CAEN
MFNKDTAPLKIPCKYRLADFTCGDYQVKVTPGSTVTVHGGFTPGTAWVKVINLVTMETVKVRTSLDLLEKSEAGTDNAWKIQEGSTELLDFAGYDAGVARLEKHGVFKVEFAFDSVEVSCIAEEFVSPGLPETLCGDGLSPGELEAAANSTFGTTNHREQVKYLQYAVLNDTTVTQSKACEALPSHFQSCDSKVDALYTCYSVFNFKSTVLCYGSKGKPVQDFFDDCLKYKCDGDSTDAVSMLYCLM